MIKKITFENNFHTQLSTLNIVSAQIKDPSVESTAVFPIFTFIWKQVKRYRKYLVTLE